MDAVKQAVAQALEKQGIISQLKAQLRAQVFLAVEEYETASTGSGLAAKSVVAARSAVLSESSGQLAVQLVLDLLDTCNLAFTKQVLLPELGPSAPSSGRQAVASRLGLTPASNDEPLLVALIKAFHPGQPLASTTAAAPTPSASGPRTGIGAPPLPRAEPLAPATKSSLAPLGPPKVPTPSAVQPGSGRGAPSAVPSEPPRPAAKEASAESEYSDEEFEEEPVDDDVEEEGPGAAADEDDEDYATAMGFSTTPAATARQEPSGARQAAGGALGTASAGGRGRVAPLDSDLMAGDRSFGMSNELAGLDAGNSGGLSFSADFPGGMSDQRPSLSTSQAMLSPISESTPKPTKLEPLRPLGGSKLSPLAPLPTIGTLSSSLSSSRDDPLASKGPKPLAPLGAPGRKPLVDIEKEKDELRKLGLLQSGDSLSTSLEADTRPRPSGAPGNIYDGEMSVSASQEDGAWSGGGGAGGWGGAREDRPPFGSKGLSMDLRDTGLSASDRSGDIGDMGVDLAETAEWH